MGLGRKVESPPTLSLIPLVLLAPHHLALTRRFVPVTRNSQSPLASSLLLLARSLSYTMSSAVALGLGALGAAFAGRVAWQMMRRGAADKWVKGGFKAKMDRSEAVSILGLR